MILMYGLGLILSIANIGGPSAVQDDPTAALRRLAATAQLAAQEYAIGVESGTVVSQAEVDEAELFLAEALRAADGLPDGVRSRSRIALESILSMIRATAAPTDVALAVAELTSGLAQELGIALDALPDLPPSQNHGADLYQAECASCHGDLGAGDGPAAAALDPPPADLSDFFRLSNQSPLDFYRRVTIGVAGTAMPPFEDILSEEERWAVALYTSRLRLPEASGEVPAHLWWFTTTARMSDDAIAHELSAQGVDASAAAVASVRAHVGPRSEVERAQATMALVRVQADSAYDLALEGRPHQADAAALNAYITFEGVEPQLRSRSPGLASQLEGAFATYRAGVSAASPPQELRALHGALLEQLQEAQAALGHRLTPFELFFQSLVILLREGIEAILIIGALIAFLVKTGAEGRRRDVYLGVGAALAASILTAVLIETVFHISVAQQELLEGATMLLAAGVLFYVSYWLLSKMEVARWNHFVRGKVQRALAGGSVLALPTVAFLAVYREGFETVLFYKALFVSSGAVGAAIPVALGMLAASVLLAGIYLAISRYGVRIPLKQFFGITGVFLYYMAFVFAGKGILELQGAGVLGVTYVPWAPIIPALGVYGTAEGMLVQGILVLLFVGAIAWTFFIEPRRLKVTSVLVPEPEEPSRNRDRSPAGTVEMPERDLVRSLERMDADLAEVRAEISRIKDHVTEKGESLPSRIETREKKGKEG
jgi:high-affinity iron transporter